MLSHSRVWAAIDALAQKQSLTTSGLARSAGLDPTTFNKSKRHAADGRERWPSTESLSKIIKATGIGLDDFMDLLQQGAGSGTGSLRRVKAAPLLGFAQAGVGGFFDDGGYPAGQGWDEVIFPSQDDDSVYALEVSGDSMMPLYRDGDTIIVSPGSSVRRGDRVVIKTKEGEVMAKVLARKTAKTVELHSLNPEHPDLTFDLADLEWMARIIWASQ